MLDRAVAKATKTIDISLFERGWGNDGFHATGGYLEDVLNSARQTKGDILEAGSGLTTLLLNLVAPGRAWTLEHSPEFYSRTVKTLKRYNLDSSRVLLAPLEDFGEFVWYSPPRDLPICDLVIADGPPGDTKGGRYGLLPRMRESLSQTAMILLDDAQREGELTTLKQWQDRFGIHYTLKNSGDRAWACCRFN